MFGMKKRELTRGDILIKQLSDLLFPPFRTEEIGGEKIAIDASVDTNIDAVLSDLKDGYLDETCINTVQAIFDRLYKARELMNAFHQIDAGVSKYIITMEKPADIAEKITAADDEEVL